MAELNSTQLKSIRNTVAGRVKDTHGQNVDKQTENDENQRVTRSSATAEKQ